MIKINVNKWNKTPQYLREQALSAEHPRTRERYLALYEITQGKSATQVSIEMGRRPHTLLDWVHNYNEKGNAGICYQRTGGRPPFFLSKLKTV